MSFYRRILFFNVFASMVFGLAFAKKMDSVALVVKFKGNVQFESRVIKVGDELSAGGLLTVGAGKDDFVDIEMAAGHTFRLKKNAKMRLIAEPKSEKTVLNLLSGQLYSHFRKKAGVENIEIHTKSVVAGVRGTQFLVEEDDAKGSYICVCEGAVNVTGIGSHVKDGARVVSAGEDLWARPGKVIGQPISSPSMSKMTQDEFADMEARWK
jgi:ferric-dicitrate binding protein FerR (iron transport regulator)